MRLALASIGLVLSLIPVGCSKSFDSAAASSGATPSGWKEFAPEQDKFAVRMPGDPALRAGNDMSDTKTWTSDGGNLVYLIQYTQLSDPSIEQDQRRIEDTLDNTFDTMEIKENLANLEQKKAVSLAGASGREIEGTTPDKKVKRIRLCIAGGRIYRAEVTGTKDAVDAPDAEAFFNSLKIVR
jgi:hypothetical protein